MVIRMHMYVNFMLSKYRTNSTYQGIGNSPVIKELEEDGQNIGVSFFDLVQEHNRFGILLELGRKNTSFAVSLLHSGRTRFSWEYVNFGGEDVPRNPWAVLQVINIGKHG